MWVRGFLLLKKNRVDNSRDNIVKGMGSSGDSKTPNGKKNRKVNTCNGPKTKLWPGKRSSCRKLSVDKNYMMMGAK